MNEVRSKRLRIALFAIGFSAVVAVFYFDLLNYLTIENVQFYKVKLGLWAPVVFMLAFVIGELLQIPSVLWMFFAGLIWPVWLALPIALGSAMLAAIGAFLVARYFLGEKFHDKLPGKLRKLNENISKNPLKAVILIRLSTFLHPLVHWALAASPVKLPAFIIGTFIGILPASIAIVLLGQQFIDWWDQYSNFIIAGIIVAVGVFLFIKRKQASNQTTIRPE